MIPLAWSNCRAQIRGIETIRPVGRVANLVGMVVEIEDPGVFSASIPAGAVAVQRPHGGFQVKAGAKVTVRLSLGNERVAVPLDQRNVLQAGVNER